MSTSISRLTTLLPSSYSTRVAAVPWVTYPTLIAGYHTSYLLSSIHRSSFKTTVDDIYWDMPTLQVTRARIFISNLYTRRRIHAEQSLGLAGSHDDLPCPMVPDQMICYGKGIILTNTCRIICQNFILAPLGMTHVTCAATVRLPI